MIPQLRQLLETGVYQPAPAPVPLGSIDFPQAERQSQCRIIMTAEKRVPAFDGLTTVVQVSNKQGGNEQWQSIKCGDRACHCNRKLKQ